MSGLDEQDKDDEELDGIITYTYTIDSGPDSLWDTLVTDDFLVTVSESVLGPGPIISSRINDEAVEEWKINFLSYIRAHVQNMINLIYPDLEMTIEWKDEYEDSD
jgi:hypothetical protein